MFSFYLNRQLLYTLIARVIVCPLVLFVGTLSLTASPDNQGILPGGDLGISAHIGKSYLHGFYRDYLTDTYSAGIGIIYPLPVLYENLYAEGEFLGSRSKLRESEESSFDLFTLRAGLTYSYPFLHYFQPYAGLYVQESHVKLTAERIGEEDTSFKTGAAVKTGFFSSIHRDFSLRIGAEYSVMPLSGERLESIAFTAAVIVRVPLSGNYDNKTPINH